MSLPAFAAERRAAAPLLLSARRGQSMSHQLLPAWRSAAKTPLLRYNDWTDGRTDGRTPDRYIDLHRILRGQRQLAETASLSFAV